MLISAVIPVIQWISAVNYIWYVIQLISAVIQLFSAVKLKCVILFPGDDNNFDLINNSDTLRSSS